jgi:hypothetical protein
LTKFGVQPVTLSMAAVAPMTPYLPTAISVSPQIEISNIELLDAPYPGYRITLRNLGQKGVSVTSAHHLRNRGRCADFPVTSRFVRCIRPLARPVFLTKRQE